MHGIENLSFIGFIAGAIFIALLTIGLIIARLYKRASKELSFVRTGLGGQKVIMNGGALVLPVLHETIPVNMNTLRLAVRRSNDQALITKDRMRVDVLAEFYVRVKPTEESIANAAQTLGTRTVKPDALKDLIEGKFVDALRAVAAEMEMTALHEQRVDFVQKVQQVVSEDLLKNGLELEAVSLTGLDQTSKKFFNPDNAFDAEGLTKLTEAIEQRRKIRNDIERETEVQIQQKNLDAQRQSLEISKEEAYAQLEQEREIAMRTAEQKAEIAAKNAQMQREAENAKIGAEQEIAQARILSTKKVEEDTIDKDRVLKERDVEKQKVIELAEQERNIAVAEKSKLQSVAQAEADKARAEAIKAKEQVITAQEIEKAEREKATELVEAAKIAERDAITIKVAAEADKAAAADKAEAIHIAASAAAEKVKIAAKADADAEILRAEAAEKRYKVDAEGKRALNEAANLLSEAQIAMQIKFELLQQLPEIIAQSVKPMENIDSIKIVQVDGLSGAPASGEPVAGSGNLADQVVTSALRYKAQSPLVESLLKEVGLSAGDLQGMTQPLNGAPQPDPEA